MPTPAALREARTRTIAPICAHAADAIALEDTLSQLVNEGAGLSGQAQRAYEHFTPFLQLSDNSPPEAEHTPCGNNNLNRKEMRYV